MSADGGPMIRRRVMRHRIETMLVSVGVLVVASGGTAGATDVLTQRYDNARTGANTGETTLNVKNVNPDGFGKLWTLYADAQVVAQPLYVSRLAVDTTANHDPPLVNG